MLYNCSQVLKAFFKTSIRASLSDEQNEVKLKQMVIQVNNYLNLKQLSGQDTLTFIAKNQRDRYTELMKSFFDKYENLYGTQDKPKIIEKKTPIKVPIMVEVEEDETIKCCICYEAK